MKPLLAPIQLHETSFNVIRLHQALAAFGFEVSEHERTEHFAGKTTLEQTRALQRSLKIAFDTRLLVDNQSAVHINRELQGRGLFKDETYSFKIKGTVTFSSGQIAKRHRLLAVDVDLKGAKVYRGLKNLTELKASPGFEMLEEFKSDSRGNYETIFNYSQFAKAERQKADVVVFALDGDEIVGRSRMVSSSQYAESGEVKDLDVVINRTLHKQTEYASLISKLEPFLRQSGVTLESLGTSADQVLFTSRELDVRVALIRIAVSAEALRGGRQKKISHELLYGIGRQGISLNWTSLYRSKPDDLREAIDAASDNSIIKEFDEKTVTAFLTQLHEAASVYILDFKADEKMMPLDKVLSGALPQREQREAFIEATRAHKGDGASFWTEYLPGLPEFKEKPELIDNLKVLHQFTLISANHQPLVHELSVTRKLTSAKQLVELSDEEWMKILSKTGIPENIHGTTAADKQTRYLGFIKQVAHAAFPTHKILTMIKGKELTLANDKVASDIQKFLETTTDFDIRSSRVASFEEKIKAISPENFELVTKDLKRVQRLFQVSPTAEVLSILMQSELKSAHDIANFPKKTFIRTFSGPMGGNEFAEAVYQRANYTSGRAEHFAMKMQEATAMASPDYVMTNQDQQAMLAEIENQVPNYSNLFGSPDICECDHCRSVYSPAAYFVDLLRFLWRGDLNKDDFSPLDMFSKRRPDLLHLPLTCENTNTVIPYIDLVNEVMEYYTANDKLDKDAAFDTGDTTAEELRAAPQNSNIEAYRKLKKQVFPFTLPYHQPLDVIRTYSDHLNAGREEVMKSLQTSTTQTTQRAIIAESLRLSPEEYAIITRKTFDDQNDQHAVHACYGYTNQSGLVNLAGVPEFLDRTGIAYTDLVELIKTKFINPHQDVLDFLQDLFSETTMSPSTIYDKLVLIESGQYVAQLNDPLLERLAEVNISFPDFTMWVQQHLNEFRSVITLYQSDSMCDLGTTSLRILENIYAGQDESGIGAPRWSKIHRFIRLWRKLNWTIHELDLVLVALGETDITPETIEKLSAFVVLKNDLKRPLNELATWWGNIDTYGSKSLYKKLFLNKAVQRIDTSFQADEWNNYLSNPAEKLGDHLSAILAAFRMSEEDLQAVLTVATVLDNNTSRLLTLDDRLSIENLTVIYRHVVFAKAVKFKVKDLCLMIQLFQLNPFSVLDLQQGFVSINTEITATFADIAGAVKNNRFKPATLQYIFTGVVAPDSILGLSSAKVMQSIKLIREAFIAIEQLHADMPPEPITVDVVRGKFSITFQPDIAFRLFEVIEGTALFETIAPTNLMITIPEAIAEKFSYIRGNGKLTAKGVMTTIERQTLQTLPNATVAFIDAVDTLFAAPEAFIRDHFQSLFDDPDTTIPTLLDGQNDLASKLSTLYVGYLPFLKEKLRSDAIVQHIAALIGLSEEVTAILVRANLSTLMTTLAEDGFSATYYSDTTGTNIALERIDPVLDFAWDAGSPDQNVPAENFSARWRAYVAAPVSGDYTFTVNVRDADESFKFYVDDVLWLEKIAGDATVSLDVIVPLTTNQPHKIVVEYIEQSQNAGISIFWKTATTAKEIIPSALLYPTTVVEMFSGMTTVFHRAAQFITGFKLDEREIDHFVNNGDNFDNIDFNALTAQHWIRIERYVYLRSQVPQSQASLIDVFTVANKVIPIPTADQLRELLYAATAWDYVAMQYLIQTHFALTVNDFKNEIALLRLLSAIELVRKTGISAVTLAQWALPEVDFDLLNDTAQLVKSTVKAKYEETDWLSLAGGLSDKIRENQKSALISYLLTRPALKTAKVYDADGLFEHFLIDVQMGAKMDTSRIVQASAAIQMYVNRCLLNKESEMASNGDEHGVSPGYVDAERWEWMKYYRVWEANRKVFLYPENWLEPEWRDDRSPFFKELESELVQNDITDRSVENAFRNYLTKLNSVANLEVCGSIQEYEEGNPLLYHVFARTNTIPYQYFYRTWSNTYRKWTAWDRVGVDIRGVEAESAFGKTGVHLIPVVWKKRLFLFWPEFIKKSETSSPGNGTAWDSLGESISSFSSTEYWEGKLAWSEYIDGKWSAKQITKESFNFNQAYPDRLSFYSSIVPSTQELTITGWIFKTNIPYVFMKLADIQSPVSISYPSSMPSQAPWSEDEVYSPEFMKVERKSKLTFLGNEYLKNTLEHRLHFSNHITNINGGLAHPFFYTAKKHTYFARPIEVWIANAVENPETTNPFIPGIYVDDSGWNNPIDIPDYNDPDNYREEIVFLNDTGVLEMIGNPLYKGQQEIGQGEVEGAVVMMKKNAKSNGIAIGSNGNGSAVVMQKRSIGSDGVEADALKMEEQYPTAFSSEAYTIGQAFGGYQSVEANYGDITAQLTNGFHKEKGLEFHTFYHPYSSNYVTRLNQGNIDKLMTSDTKLPNDQGSHFVSRYAPNASFVPEGAEFDKRTFYKENVCFDVYGANSIYNWELFFHGPLYIATRLSKNGQYEEAMKWFHYIFNPTTDKLPEPGESEISRFWQVLPFKTEPIKDLQQWFMELEANNNPSPEKENGQIGEWRDDPFKPHLVARNRPIAYMKNVVIKYVQNLVDWADSLFRIDTRETVNDALQLYVMANHILGPRPQFVPKRGEIKAETYTSLKYKWDDFSNAIVELENIFPYSSEISSSNSNQGNLLGGGPALYFCIPSNEKLLETWDLVADRLFKIRHCMNIDGVERSLALFAPPIDPAVLVNAVAQGLSLGSILADLSSPPPLHRFNFLLQRAKELTSEVKSLGNALLSSLEKKDSEELSLLRSTHEIMALDMMSDIKERQVLEAKSNRDSLVKSRELTAFKVSHYTALLGNEDITIPDIPTLSASLNSQSQLPADTALSTQSTDIDELLDESEVTGVKLIPKESQELSKLSEVLDWQSVTTGVQMTASILNAIPNFSIECEPFGVGGSVSFGGSNLGAIHSAVAEAFSLKGTVENYHGTVAGKFANYIRREQDWTLQLNLALKEIIQIDKQIVGADIRIQVAEKELENHYKAIENAKEVEAFIKNKFTNQELYQWMKEQIFSVYKQSYNMAYDMAKKVEKAYRYEIGNELTNFIQYGYWDSSKQGLLAGERLQLALLQMEKSYVEENRRELELTKHVSLALWNPLALQELKETGKCFFSIPEELLDMDFQGHYYRRIKSVSISLPCIAGPHTTINCTLRLLQNKIRVNTSLNDDSYEHNNEDGVLIDDDRFRSNNAPVKSIATCTGQQDDGLFELSFRDERYLPFEGAGAISDWKLELTTASELRQFNYQTISDVVVHLNFTAREDAGNFKIKCEDYIKNFIANVESTRPLVRMINMKHEFATEWHKFLYPSSASSEQVLTLTLSRDHFPFFARNRAVQVTKVNVMAKATGNGDYHMIMSALDTGAESMTSPMISLSENAPLKFGKLKICTLTGSSAINLEEMDVFSPMSFKIKHNSETTYDALDVNPDELQEMALVIHYVLGDPIINV